MSKYTVGFEQSEEELATIEQRLDAKRETPLQAAEDMARLLGTVRTLKARLKNLEDKENRLPGGELNPKSFLSLE